jgi:phage-related protein
MRPPSSLPWRTSATSASRRPATFEGDIYEVRAEGERAAYRVLFAPEGRSGQVLLALEGFSKKAQRTPAHLIGLAERRLVDWRRRATR